MLSPYLLRENDAYSYEFVIDTGIRYKVYFLDYSFMFQEYTNIHSPIYSFNIDATEGDPDTVPGDERIGSTIAYIMDLFFATIDNVAVYVCDSLDDRQYARKRKFDLWFHTYNNGSLMKEDGVALVDGVEILNAILLHKQHQQLQAILDAFRVLNQQADNK